MQFIHSFWWLIFAVPLVPLIIHLINLLRHERIEWAAMEFLLKSYKKHSQHVWLMQLLLLLLRMLLIACVVAMLAQLVTPAWSVLRGRTTHHYVLVDDSYSMSDRVAGDSAFDKAKAAMAQIGSWATRQDTSQKYTLIRFSQARAMEGAKLPPNVDRESVVDLNSEVVDLNFDVTLINKRNTFDVTQLASTPLAALKMARQLMTESPDENRIVYIISDFRANEWDQPAEVKAELANLKQETQDIHLIDCVDAEHNNLGIVYLAPEERTRAAGVPLFVDIKVKNHGKEVARKVQIKFTSIYNPPGGAKGMMGEGPGAPQAEELPPVFIEQIAPGETAVTRTQVYFPTQGEHVVMAELPEDAVATDNRRWTVVDFPAGNPVLFVDGNLQRDNEFFLTAAFALGGGDGESRVRTGILAEPKTLADLRDSSPETLAKYHSIYLMDVERLDPKAADNLKKYVEGGGGLGIFLGPSIDLKFYNQTLYADGKGILPLPLGPRDILPPPESPDVPDFVVSDHPIWKVFASEKDSTIRRIDINQYYTPAKGWVSPDTFVKPAPVGPGQKMPEEPKKNEDIKVLATLYNRLPLVLEKRVGDGRVVLFLTSLAPLRPDASSPKWHNWVEDPFFVVLMLELQSYLASSRRNEAPRLVGSPIELQFPADKYLTKVEFHLPPTGKEKTGAAITREATRPTADSPVLETSIGIPGAAGKATRDTWSSGVYDAVLTRTDGSSETRRYALNVEPSEGELARLNQEQLKAKMPEIEFKYHAAQDLESELKGGAGGSQWSEILFVLVIAMLLGEQALAYACGYHPQSQAQPQGATR